MDGKKKGDVIETREGSRYHIISVISQGEKAYVYRAKRRIGDGESQTVLLKEFFIPEDSKMQWYDYEAYIDHELHMNKVIRNCGFPGALTIEYKEHGKENEKEDGNRVGRTSGAIYGVITNLREGETLREYVQSAWFRYATLRDRIEIVWRIAILIRNFHRECGMIHGDITPDNIFMIEIGSESRAGEHSVPALMDFETSRYREEEREADFPVFATEGYAMQDIMDGERKQPEEADDWFGCVCCLWYCLSGRDIRDYGLTEEHIKETIDKIAVSYERNTFGTSGEEERAFIQSQIAHYENVSEAVRQIFTEDSSLTEMLAGKLQDVLDLLDDAGIGRQRLLVNLQEEYHALRNERFSSLSILQNILPNVEFHLPESTPRFIRSKKSQPETLKQIFDSSQSSLFMIGDGGMGKTTSLIGIMDDAYREEAEKNDWNKDDPIAFLELCVLSQDSSHWYDEKHGGTFIEQFLASYLTGQPRRFLTKDHPYVKAIQEELYRMPETENGEKEYTVLLDGMNEIGFIDERSRLLFYESINHYLKYAKNLRLIITGRNDVYELSSQYLLRLKALGLDDGNIINVLNEAVIEGKIAGADYQKLIGNKDKLSTKESRLWKCLKIPFFLMMYCVSSNKKNVESQGEILRNFFHDKREVLNGDTSYGEQSQAQIRHRGKRYGAETKLSMEYALKAVLDFLIPEIAIRMVEENHFFITRDKIYTVIGEYFDRLEKQTRHQGWVSWYYGYEKEIKLIFREIRQIDGGRQIPEYACDVLGIMRATANDTYFFTHQYFRDYFAACALINRMLDAIEEREYILDGWDADSEEFAESIYPLHEQEISDYICALVGEILEERKNVPVYDVHRRTWTEQEDRTKEQEVLRKFLDSYRNIRSMSRGTQTGLKNVISILKKSRIRSDGMIDFSNINFAGLDVSQLSLKGILFSHSDREGNLVRADFRRAEGTLKALRKDEREQRIVCCGVHPSKRRILVLNVQTDTLTELDLENGESRFTKQAGPGYIQAWYMGEQDDILVLRTWQQGNTERLELYYHFRNGEETEDGYEYFSMNGWQKCLGASFSSKYRQLSLFLKGQNSIRLWLIGLPEYNHMDEFEFQIIRPEKVPLEKVDIRHVGKDTFMFTRLDEAHYLLGDSENWKWNIGIWDIRGNSIRSVFYSDKDVEKGKDGFRAACYEKEREALYISAGRKFGIQRSKDLDSLEAYGDWSMHVDAQEDMVVLSDKDMLLRLYQGTLHAYDIEDKSELWNCSGLTVTQMFAEKGLLIANADDGIYEIDITDGSFRCLQQYQKDRTTFLIGRTTNDRDLLLYESTGVVKWVDIRNRNCFRQTALQYPDIEKGLEDIFYDEEREELYGITGDRVYRWDGWSGEQKSAVRLDYDNDWKIYYTEFDFTSGILDVYFERKDYQKFPLQKRYSRWKWMLRQEKWVTDRVKEENGMFRMIRGDKPGMTGVERVRYMDDSNPEYKAMNDRASEHRAANDRVAGHKRLYYDEWDTEETEANVQWDTEYNLGRTAEKEIRMKYQQLWFNVADIQGDKQAIGITGKGILYTVDWEVSHGDMELFRPGEEELIRFGKMPPSTFRKAIVIGDTFIGLAGNRNSKRYKERLYFWNVNEDQIYHCDINEKVYAAGCLVDDWKLTSPREQKLASTEGMIRPDVQKKREKGIRIKRIEKKSTFETRSMEERRHQRNYPAVICAVLLVAIDYLRRIFLGSSISSLQVNILRLAMVQGIMLMMSLWLGYVYPQYISKWQWKNLHEQKGKILILSAALLPAKFLMDYFMETKMIVRPTVTAFMAIPVMWLYLYECPLKDRKALYTGLVFNSAWMCLILMDTSQYVCVRMGLILSIFLSELYVVLKNRFYIEGREDILKTMAGLVGIPVAGYAGVRYIVDRMGGGLWNPDWIQSPSAFWRGCLEHAGKNIREYHLVGSMQNSWGDNYLDMKDFWPVEFPLNYIMERCGLLFGVAVIVIGFMMLYFLWKGVRKQEVFVDQCICMSCALYLTIQTLAGALAMAGIGFAYARPAKIPFVGGTLSEQQITWLVFGLYLIFYKAHRRQKK